MESRDSMMVPWTSELSAYFNQKDTAAYQTEQETLQYQKEKNELNIKKTKSLTDPTASR